tara:strand:+ start:451 stop:669 length:219 start_codon:yes stop_codon:yes gene_type:complete
MIETVIALFMSMAGELKEFKHQNSIHECLMKKRVAERNSGNNIRYSCGKVNATVEVNNDGSKSIKKIINKNK